VAEDGTLIAFAPIFAGAFVFFDFARLEDLASLLWFRA
jgi:hypothetical protein